MFILEDNADGKKPLCTVLKRDHLAVLCWEQRLDGWSWVWCECAFCQLHFVFFLFFL